MNDHLRVMKFGGSSLAGASRIARAAAIVASEGGRGTLVVASAMGGETEALLALVETAVRGDDAMAAERLDSFAARHRDAAFDLALSRQELGRLLVVIESERRRLAFRLASIAWSKSANPADRDEVVAAGELLSSQLLASALRAGGVRASWLDPRELVITKGRNGSARPDNRAIARAVTRLLLPILRAGDVAVTGGFVGRSRSNGATTTLGRGGSDWTATILGAALPAAIVEIWTDVDGLLTADPRVDRSAALIEHVSWGLAEAMAEAGAKVLHPATVGPARERGIPIRIRNTFRPEGTGTMIGAANPPASVEPASSTASCAVDRAEGRRCVRAAQPNETSAADATSRKTASISFLLATTWQRPFDGTRRSRRSKSDLRARGKTIREHRAAPHFQKLILKPLGNHLEGVQSGCDCAAARFVQFRRREIAPRPSPSNLPFSAPSITPVVSSSTFEAAPAERSAARAEFDVAASSRLHEKSECETRG